MKNYDEEASQPESRRPNPHNEGRAGDGAKLEWGGPAYPESDPSVFIRGTVNIPTGEGSLGFKGPAVLALMIIMIVALTASAVVCTITLIGGLVMFASLLGFGLLIYWRL